MKNSDCPNTSNNISIAEYIDMIPKALKIFLETNIISRSILSKKLLIGFAKASTLFEKLIDLDFIYITESNEYRLTITNQEFENEFKK